MKAIRIRYIFPKTENFRETRPLICWEDMYGWLDGYGLFFDPVLQQTLGILPEWENGWNGAAANGDFFVSPCRQATATLESARLPGLYVRPMNGVDIPARNLASDKERLLTPSVSFYYPQGLRYDRPAQGLDGWLLGEYPAVAQCGEGRVAVAFEFFSMIWAWNADWPERRLIEGGGILQALLAASGCFKPQPKKILSGLQEETRLDFQAYGLNRLFVQWLLDIHRQDRSAVGEADLSYRCALAAWQADDAEGIRAGLTAAFAALANLRKAHSQLDVYFCEYPHMGILLDNKGFFELEWPEYSRRIIEWHTEQVRKRGYKVSLEAGANCWKNLANRFPKMAEQVRCLWDEGRIELTNGTYSLPYGLVSPLAFQYWQLQQGQETFRRVFKRVPVTYQAQENSLAPQMPELLCHFGYERALHISQNRGTAPEESTNFITWQSPAGCGVPAMGAREQALSNKGMNYYFDLPIVHRDYGNAAQPLNYVNFHDLGCIPFRAHMIRAHRYAPVWGAFALSGERFDAEYTHDVPARAYPADAYRLSANIFYGNSTNANAFSQYERVFTLAHRYRQTQFMAFASGRLGEFQPELEAMLPALLTQEAHDVAIVQDQRRGEFHANCTVDAPPYSRDTLMEEVRLLSDDTTRRIDEVQRSLAGGADATALYNASGVVLPYAHVRHAEKCRGTPLLPYRGGALAAGPFAPFAAIPATKLGHAWVCAALPVECGPWTAIVRPDGRLTLARQGREVICAPVDRLRGEFKLLKSEAWECGPFTALHLTFAREDDIQVVRLDILLHAEASFAEFGVRYAPRGDFNAKNRWKDYLALEFDCGAPFDTLWRFNPNVRSVTEENRIVSPCYLAARSGNAAPLAFMNEGAFAYEADRAAGKLRWLFHVANETIRERRMALAFGKDEALELSRAWSQGVAPLERCDHALPELEGVDWTTIIPETFARDGKLMISNLSGQPVCFRLPRTCALQSASGQPRGEQDGQTLRCSLGAFEIAFLRPG